jgi:transitional endoplasmic reticulum ATPase
MSGIEELSGVVVLATTNRLDLVDPALLVAGRFDLVLELPLPDQAAREAIFGIALRKKPLSDDVDIEELARRTEGRSGADVVSICRKAAMLGLREAAGPAAAGSVAAGSVNGETLLLERRHFAAALAGN